MIERYNVEFGYFFVVTILVGECTIEHLVKEFEEIISFEYQI